MKTPLTFRLLLWSSLKFRSTDCVVCTCSIFLTVCQHHFDDCLFSAAHSHLSDSDLTTPFSFSLASFSMKILILQTRDESISWWPSLKGKKIANMRNIFYLRLFSVLSSIIQMLSVVSFIWCLPCHSCTFRPVIRVVISYVSQEPHSAFVWLILRLKLMKVLNTCLIEMAIMMMLQNYLLQYVSAVPIIQK